MPRRADLYLSQKRFERIFGITTVIREVVQPTNKKGAVICVVCKKSYGQMEECSRCFSLSHEVCGGAYSGVKFPVCEGCGREESDSDLSEAVCVGIASTTTSSNAEEESLGSLRDMIVSETDSDSINNKRHQPLPPQDKRHQPDTSSCSSQAMCVDPSNASTPTATEEDADSSLGSLREMINSDPTEEEEEEEDTEFENIEESQTDSTE